MLDAQEVVLRDGSKYILGATPNEEVVTDSTIWSETHVRSTGGGGFVHPTYGGHVSAPQVHSTVTERQSYFIKTEGGKEFELRDAVTARKGHIIREVWGCPYPWNKEERCMLATKNITTSDYRGVRLRPKNLKNYFSLFGCTPIAGKYLGSKLPIFIMLFVTLALIGISGGLLLFIIVPVIIAITIYASIERRKRIHHLDNALLSFVKSVGSSSD